MTIWSPTFVAKGCTDHPRCQPSSEQRTNWKISHRFLLGKDLTLRPVALEVKLWMAKGSRCGPLKTACLSPGKLELMRPQTKHVSTWPPSFVDELITKSVCSLSTACPTTITLFCFFIFSPCHWRRIEARSSARKQTYLQMSPTLLRQTLRIPTLLRIGQQLGSARILDNVDVDICCLQKTYSNPQPSIKIMEEQQRCYIIYLRRSGDTETVASHRMGVGIV